jgi:RNA polymerase sigma-70 factor (ECF subfamily)
MDRTCHTYRTLGSLSEADDALQESWLVGGKPRVAFAFTIRDGKVAAVDLLADPQRLGQINLTILE